MQELNQIQIKALRYIRNNLVHKGSMPSIRDLMKELDYKSPRSAALVIGQLLDLEFLGKTKEGKLQLLKSGSNNMDQISTVDVPLIGTVACGAPILAEENIQGYFKVSITLAKPSHKYFLLRAQGDSMNNAGIKDGDLVLVKQADVAEEGQDVVALIDDEATIKRLKMGNNTAILEPKSSNKLHKPIIVHEDFRIQGIVITTI